MGRKWKRKNKNKHSGEGKPRDSKKNPDWGKERDPYSMVAAGNFRMEAFYAYQGVHDSRLQSEDGSFVECSTAEEKEAAKQAQLLDWLHIFHNKDTTRTEEKEIPPEIQYRRERIGTSIGIGLSSLRDIYAPFSSNSSNNSTTRRPTPPLHRRLSPHFVPKILPNCYTIYY